MAAHATIPFSSSSTLQTLTRILSQPEDRQLCLIFLRFPFVAALLMLARPLPPPRLDVRRDRPQRHHSSPATPLPLRSMTPTSHVRSSNRPHRQIWCLSIPHRGRRPRCCPIVAFLEPPRRRHLHWFPQQAAIQDPWLGYMALAARKEAVAKKGLQHHSRHDLGL